MGKISCDSFSTGTKNYGGHVGRRLEFRSYSNYLLERLSTCTLLLKAWPIQPQNIRFTASWLVFFHQKCGVCPSPPGMISLFSSLTIQLVFHHNCPNICKYILLPFFHVLFLTECFYMYNRLHCIHLCSYVVFVYEAYIVRLAVA